MTFKEMALQEASLRKIPFQSFETENNSLINQLIHNQSPIMKLWFGLMLMNCVVLLFI
jgi:hypothetical protein